MATSRLNPEKEAAFRSKLAGANPILQGWGEALVSAIKTYNLLLDQIRTCEDDGLKLPALRQAQALLVEIESLQASIKRTIGMTPFKLVAINASRDQLASAIRKCEAVASRPLGVLPGLPQPRAC